jgi:perosamine synthetase
MDNPSKYLGNELKYVEKVLNSESWSATGGNWNNALERQFCEKFGVKYAVAMNSGTSTLHAALTAAGIGQGDEVISPALTVIMDATATLHAGAIPVFADVDPLTFNIDPEDIERKITKRTRAIIPVALYGLPPDLDPIMDLAEKYGLVVIEDNAQCVLGKYKGQMAGTIGDMASFSFENTKHLSCGEGGMIVTNDECYAEMVRKIGGHGFKNLKADEGRVRLNQDVFQNPHYKRHDVLGWNYRLSEFNAAVALAQLERVDELVEMRIFCANLFIEAMEGCDFLTPQYVPDGYTNSYYTLGVVYDGDSWEGFRQAYIANGGDGIYGAWSVPYLEPVMSGRSIMGDCPVAEFIQPKLMQFKTNYRDRKYAETKAYALWKTIQECR